MICDKLINYKQSKSIPHLSVETNTSKIEKWHISGIIIYQLNVNRQWIQDSLINEIRFDTMVGIAKSANPLYASIDNSVAKNAFILFKHHSCCIFTVK